MSQVVIDLSGLPKVVNEAYLPRFNDKKRYLVLYGGAGSGKSIFAAQKLLFRILTEDNHRILVIRKVARTLRMSVFASLVGMVQDWKLAKFFKVNKTDMTIENVLNGSTLLFAGIDDPEKIKSIHRITSIWIEEASEITLDDFTQLDLRLRGQLEHYKQIILSFNPISSNHWLKKRFFDNTDPQASVLHTTYKDNRFLDEAYIRVLEEMAQVNYSYYEIYALGKWGSLEGVIYEQYRVVDAMPADCEVFRWGLDFGHTVPSAAVKIGIIGRELFVHELLYESHLTNADLIERIKTEHPELKNVQGFLDSAEPDRIQEFKNAGFRVYPAHKNVRAGIDKVKSYALNITATSQNILREIETYVWKTTKAGEPLDEPVKQNDHSMDALRYAVFTGNEPIQKPWGAKLTL